MKHAQPAIIALYGASGFLGQHTIRHLLESTNYTVRAVSRNPDQIIVEPQHEQRLQRVAADIFDYDAIRKSLHQVHTAVYLIHMMARKGDYYAFEAQAAELFGQASHDAGLQRIVYMSGLGNERDKLSKHLASRHHTGRILKQYVPVVIELRASMIVGEGSIAYDIMRRFVKQLPIQAMPKWAITQTQPITAHDAVTYIEQSITVNVDRSVIVDIGGPEQMSYKDLIARYAEYIGKKPLLIVVPIVPVWLGALWLNLFTPKRHARIGRQMAESLTQPMVIVNNRAQELFPDIVTEHVETAFS